MPTFHYGTISVYAYTVHGNICMELLQFCLILCMIYCKYYYLDVTILQVVEGLNNPLVTGQQVGQVITPIPSTELQLFPMDTPKSVGTPTRWK